MDKRLKWSIAISVFILLAVPFGVVLKYYIENRPIPPDNSLIDVESGRTIAPTPSANIVTNYSIEEIQSQDEFLYKINITFNIIQGLEPEFYYHDRLFNFTKIDILIKANYDLEFYSVVQFLNMTEFFIDSSQLVYYREIVAPARFDNFKVVIDCSSMSADESTIIGGGYNLFAKEQEIYIDNITTFSGNFYFWINENNYSLGFEIFSNGSLFYTMNSIIGDLDLYVNQILILGINGTHGYGIGSISIPNAPYYPPGSYSHSNNITLSRVYEWLVFEVMVGTSIVHTEIWYNVRPYPESTEQLDESKVEMWNEIYNYTASAGVVVAVFLGCMINTSRK